jgi:tRNA(fMet)-specific endonuclease VapC
LTARILDTDICVYYLNGRSPAVRTRVASMNPDDLAITPITAAELYYGAYHSDSDRRISNLEALETFLTLVSTVPLTIDAARQFGQLKDELVKSGKMIGVFDLLIASAALAANCTLVTNNTREFARIQGLNIENWMA